MYDHLDALVNLLNELETGQNHEQQEKLERIMNEIVHDCKAINEGLPEARIHGFDHKCCEQKQRDCRDRCQYSKVFDEAQRSVVHHFADARPFGSEGNDRDSTYYSGLAGR